MKVSVSVSEDFRAKSQFIDGVNKLEVFKLYVDDILVQLVSGSTMGLTRCYKTEGFFYIYKNK